MAISSRSTLEYWRYAKVAMLSAKEHSPNLIPVLLYGDSSGEASAAAHQNIVWYREHGGIVYHHNLTFMSDLQGVANLELRAPDWPESVEGTYLRIDIPLIVPLLLKWMETQETGSTAHMNQEEVLYTDADVLFYQEFDPCKLDLPEVMAIGPEMHRTANSWSELNWNAGVLFINLKGFSAVLPQMIQWANSRHWDFKAADQGMLNDYFPAVYGQPLSSLPEIYNWKGYWGSSPDKVILHWHGPKAERCLNCYIELWEQSKSDKSIVQQCGCPSAYDTLWNLAMDADQAALYRSAVQDHAKYADTLDDEIATLAAY